MFVDSAFWIALVYQADSLHGRAVQLSPRGRWVTSVAVRLEVMDAFSGPRHRMIAKSFWSMVRRDTNGLIVDLSDDLLMRGFTLFANRDDKAWSLTDCISFAIMTDRGIKDGLTSDHHFEQAGFRALLRDA